MDIGLPKRVIEIEPASLPVPEPAPILEPTVEPLPADPEPTPVHAPREPDDEPIRRPRMTTANSLAHALPVDLAVEPILAWRSWTLTGRRDGEGLLLRPVTAGSRAWRPREIAQATCRLAWSHEAPNLDCSCGLHATREIDAPDAVPGRAGTCRLVGSCDRTRARLPGTLRVPATAPADRQFCFWQESAAASVPDVVAWYARDLLVPMCVRHLGVAEANRMRPRRILRRPSWISGCARPTRSTRWSSSSRLEVREHDAIGRAVDRELGAQELREPGREGELRSDRGGDPAVVLDRDQGAGPARAQAEHDRGAVPGPPSRRRASPRRPAAPAPGPHAP